MAYISSDTYRTGTTLRIGTDAAEVDSVGTAATVSGANCRGTRGSKEERMEELRLSRSRSSRLPVDDRCRGELPFNMWDGIADGFEAGGEPEPMMCRQCR